MSKILYVGHIRKAKKEEMILGLTLLVIGIGLTIYGSVKLNQNITCSTIVTICDVTVSYATFQNIVDLGVTLTISAFVVIAMSFRKLWL